MQLFYLYSHKNALISHLETHLPKYLRIANFFTQRLNRKHMLKAHTSENNSTTFTSFYSVLFPYPCTFTLHCAVADYLYLM